MVDFKSWAMQLKRKSLLVYFAARDRRAPLYVRLFALFIAAYAFSPIDLIPDFIPVVGYLDDLILIPLGVALVIRLIPEEVLVSASKQAEEAAAKPISYSAAVVIAVIWLAFLYLLVQSILVYT